ncbi:DNA cytosine methyltransferase [Moraxella sp. Tifton1]|uniref:DNA cytosine methyltransferase n=1 Tax=Moraxella oculi TaxID=2940516 RepID=UPI0020135EF9|nr:DNA cytosine methyltransferase [Moraxella sp. Tifton1]
MNTPIMQLPLSFELPMDNGIAAPNQNSKPIQFIDLFAGIGGFHQALHNQGANCVFASEWDNKCRETYQANFHQISLNLFTQNHFAGDITKVNPSSIPNHDVLCAGFPCQPFSISGKQKGFDDTRGILIFQKLKPKKSNY